MNDADRIVLKTRAAALAAPPAADEGTGLTVLEFELSQELYCFEASFVQDVRPLEGLTTLPGTPAFVLGVMAVRGRVLCVLDLRPLLRLPLRGLGNHPKVLFLKGPSREFGILADSIRGVVRVSSELLPLLAEEGGGGYREGLTNRRGVLLDARKILDDTSLVVHQGDPV